jgi:GNAT superfamily N-acetyltransferase
MQPDELLALYDLQERRNAQFPGSERVETAHTLRFVDAAGGPSFVLYSDLHGLTDAAIDRVIDDEIAWFRERGAACEWKLYSHDAPPDLRERLAAKGFDVGEAETLLIRELEGAPPRLFDLRGHAVQRLTDPAQLEAVGAIESAVWGEDKGGWVERLSRDMTDAPTYVSVFVAWVDGVPAGAAWLNYSPNSDFAGLWGGSVLEAYRGRGLYGALLAARAREARERGRRFLMIDASAMSRPIVESMGFVAVATTWPCSLEGT